MPVHAPLRHALPACLMLAAPLLPARLPLLPCSGTLLLACNAGVRTLLNSALRCRSWRSCSAITLDDFGLQHLEERSGKPTML
ncbi:MAG: hypothetical protein WCI01_08545 [Chlorobiaceae bacterium]